jgi:TetR/AcrR family transcriptional regulator, transcriptional repressor for nem operon
VKVSKQKVAEHREQIIAAAAKLFREKGFDGVSVADLMKEVGLTHGGFYGHFSSKEELIGLALQEAFRETANMWENVIEDASDKPLEALAKFYLSSRHHAHPETGCLFAALGNELARQPRSVKETVMKEQLAVLDVITRVVSGRTKAARRKQAIVVLAALIGGMVLARSVSDAALSEEILKTVSTSVANSAHADGS